ncbi:trans-aconitate 2-methyltransferase [Gloeocapsa sp. PCC 73106]|uniref:class I SAM-dependent methyltransferase n=1 Tax=Gloeocapsa sp. PCC 73106 TaxID=102232 RepID=UPI0002AC61F8|nr:class I SAM-dependent methyltransferase [Gloeocapsa sp. PCC 73106]ELR97038.1 methylase involved in ubiquinone/menaquinone biosynthesis [Gloeocapsa sp. PCC 73106]
MSKENRYQEYDTWAWLYNQTMGPEYSKSQLQPIETLLLPKIAKNTKVLDVCCGTGHLVQLLSEKGYQMTGLDGSEAMLTYASKNAPQAQFILDDARTFELPPIFDAVFSTSASLNHIMSIDELKQVFERVYAALKENGLFLFDLNHPNQMTKWWTGGIAEGEITSNYAWAIASRYYPQDNTGYFKVILFQAPTNQTNPLKLPKLLLYKLLNLRILTRLRLKVLARFSQWEKNWQSSEITYHVKGYPHAEVESALIAAGFSDIELRTLEGDNTIDENHSVYFICHKAKKCH